MTDRRGTGQLVGWPAYGLMMPVFALIVLNLTLYGVGAGATTDDDSGVGACPSHP